MLTRFKVFCELGLIIFTLMHMVAYFKVSSNVHVYFDEHFVFTFRFNSKNFY